MNGAHRVALAVGPSLALSHVTVKVGNHGVGVPNTSTNFGNDDLGSHGVEADISVNV